MSIIQSVYNISKLPQFYLGRNINFITFLLIMKYTNKILLCNYINNNKMGKKISNSKLSKPLIGKSQTMLSVFNRFANKVTEAKKKKIEKVSDTKQRLMEAKKTNKMVKVSKRTSKFALIDDNQNLPSGLTHRGKNIGDLDEFNDMNFDQDIEDDDFLKAHQNLNFTGFDDQQPSKPQPSDRPKSKSEIYKEIIQKSKLHKHLRQQVYEQNFEKAVQLDKQFPDFISKLKLRNRDSNVKEKINHLDHEFEKLANQLKEDQRVVSNKVIEKNDKYTQTMKKKKNQQLNELMKDSDDEGDIRGWIKTVNQEEEEQSQINQEEDQIDEVQLSSGQQDYQGEEELQNQNQQSGQQQFDDDQQQQSEQQEQQDEEIEQKLVVKTKSTKLRVQANNKKRGNNK